MLGNLGIKEFAPVRLKRSESAFLVNSHQPAVAGDIGRQDGSQPPFDSRLSHEDCPYTPLSYESLWIGVGVCLSRNDVRDGSKAEILTGSK
jgi:hypothetical protein